MDDKKVDPVSVRFKASTEAAIEHLVEMHPGASRNKIIEMLCELGLEFYYLVDKKFGLHYKGLSHS